MPARYRLKRLRKAEKSSKQNNPTELPRSAARNDAHQGSYRDRRYNLPPFLFLQDVNSEKYKRFFHVKFVKPPSSNVRPTRRILQKLFKRRIFRQKSSPTDGKFRLSARQAVQIPSISPSLSRPCRHQCRHQRLIQHHPAPPGAMKSRQSAPCKKPFPFSFLRQVSADA